MADTSLIGVNRSKTCEVKRSEELGKATALISYKIHPKNSIPGIVNFEVELAYFTGEVRYVECDTYHTPFGVTWVYSSASTVSIYAVVRIESSPSRTQHGLSQSAPSAMTRQPCARTSYSYQEPDEGRSGNRYGVNNVGL